MSCHSDGGPYISLRTVGWLLLLLIGGFVLCSLPEMKRYIKISSM